ncbi:PQQ-binding-like beta-propeller repeat protein [Pseudoalteromonas arctica]|uniref:PQQ-binding-like beta-propeller repeat protein n=1 Tax=Pseudoalteromonas arctica TaxID=394751 RepID=A0A7Y0DSJ2_9GAMM|nr:PQQ-binding-like beta-propeller repeat protein [Pseudoalteromonas arctica]NMM39916.1 PQQ-binding-like beta-propeller repeat protein [Pseudoalteromonas arctica]
MSKLLFFVFYTLLFSLSTYANAYSASPYVKTLPNKIILVGNDVRINVPKPSLWHNESYLGIGYVNINKFLYQRSVTDLVIADEYVIFKNLPVGVNSILIKTAVIEHGEDDPYSQDVGATYPTHHVFNIEVKRLTRPQITLKSNLNVSIEPLKNAIIKFSASDAGNDLKTLKIKKGNKVVRTCTSRFSRCRFSFKGTAFGQYKFTAVAEDSFGIKSTSSPTATVNVVEKNTAPTVTLASNKTLVNAGGNVTFTLRATDNDTQSYNQIKSFKFCVGSSCRPVSNYNTSCLTTGRNLSCSISRNVSKNTVFKAIATDAGGAVESSTAVNINDTPTVAVSVSNSSPFIDEPFAINANANDSQGLRTYQICEYPAGSVPTAPTQCSGANLIKTCDVGASNCGINITKSSASSYKYYVFAEGLHGLKAHASVDVNILAPFGVRVVQLPTTITLNEPVNLKVHVGALTSAAKPLSSLKLLVNGKEQSISVSPVLPQNLPPSNTQHKEFSFSWIPKVAGGVSVQAIATDSSGKSRTSAPVTSHVSLPVPSTPSIQVGPQSNGQFTVKIEQVAYAQTYLVYENDNFIGEYSNQNYNVAISKGTKDHNKEFTYCAAAKNTVNGRVQTSARGTGNKCKTIKINNLLDSPEQPVFTTHNLQQSGPYRLSWQKNNDNLTAYYKLERWQGTPADPQTATKELLYSLSGLYKDINTLELGNFTYQISACNSQDSCTLGQQITINHIPAYIQQARLNPNCGINCMQITGVGFNNKKMRLDVRLRNTAEVFNYSLSSAQLSYIDEYNLQFKAPPRVIEGLNNGGLYLELSNGVSDAEKGSIIVDNTGANAGFDMISHAPVVSSTGSIYLGSGNDIYGLNASGQERWKVTTGGPVVAMPLLTTKNGRDNIVVGSFDHKVYSLNHDGVEQWVTQTRGPIKAAAQIDQHKNIYVGSMDKALYSLDQNTGAVQWQYILTSGITQQPVVSANNKIYVTTEDQQLHIIDRESVSLNALKWDDIDSSLIKNLLNNEPDGWQPSQQSQNIIQITKLFYALLQRAPTKAELTFLLTPSN